MFLENKFTNRSIGFILALAAPFAISFISGPAMHLTDPECGIMGLCPTSVFVALLYTELYYGIMLFVIPIIYLFNKKFFRGVLEGYLVSILFGFMFIALLIFGR